MAITKKTIRNHELIGLSAEVIDSVSESNIGVQGDVVDETQKSIVVRDTGKYKRVVKAGRLFRFGLPNGEQVNVQGDDLIGRPWERINK